MPKRLNFLDAGNFSDGESSGSDLDGFISEGGVDEGALRSKKKLRKYVDAKQEPECGPILLDDSDSEQRPGKRVLPDSSSGSDWEGPSPEKKRFRRMQQQGCCNQEGDTPEKPPKPDFELEDDCVIGGGGPSKKAVVMDSDEEGVQALEGPGKKVQAEGEGNYEEMDSKSTAGGDRRERSCKRFSLMNSDDDVEEAEAGKPCDRDGGNGGKQGVSEIMQRMMKNRAKVLSDGGSSDGVPSSSENGSEGENESDSMNDFIIEEPTVDGRAAQDGGNMDENNYEEDCNIDVRKLPDKAVLMIYLDFLMRTEFDRAFREDFAEGNLDSSDCRLQAAKKIESKLCDLMDWAVESTWRNRSFLAHLKKHPYLDIGRPPHVFGRHCEACNRRSNNAEFAIRFHGTSYTPEWTIRHRPEEVGRRQAREGLSSSEDVDEEDENETEGKEGEDGFTLVVGRYCCARIRLYHSMVHFKWRLARYIKACVEKRMKNRGSTWEECLKALSSSDTLMTRLLGHYDALVKYAGAYVSTSLPRKAAVRGLESALCWMVNSLDPSHSLTAEEEKSADEGEKE